MIQEHVLHLKADTYLLLLCNNYSGFLEYTSVSNVSIYLFKEGKLRSFEAEERSSQRRQCYYSVTDDAEYGLLYTSALCTKKPEPRSQETEVSSRLWVEPMRNQSAMPNIGRGMSRLKGSIR